MIKKILMLVFLVLQLLKLIQQIILIGKNVFNQTKIKSLTKTTIKKVTIQTILWNLQREKISESFDNLCVGNWG